MQIIINGEPKQVPDELSMSALVSLLGLGGRRLAVEVNEDLVPRSRFDEYRLSAGDQIEIVQAIGGG